MPSDTPTEPRRGQRAAKSWPTRFAYESLNRTLASVLIPKSPTCVEITPRHRECRSTCRKLRQVGLRSFSRFLCSMSSADLHTDAQRDTRVGLVTMGLRLSCALGRSPPRSSNATARRGSTFLTTSRRARCQAAQDVKPLQLLPPGRCHYVAGRDRPTCRSSLRCPSSAGHPLRVVRALC
jgi:hypothetical protein